MEWYENMKKNIYYGLLFIFLLSITIGVKASTCSDQRVLELSSLANNVNVSYQEYDKLVEEYTSETFVDDTDEDPHVKSTYAAYYLTIYNLPNDLNVSIIRNDTKKSVVAYAKDKEDDGVVYVDTGYAAKVKLFTLKIRSNDSNCQNEVLKTVAITTPMYNKFSQYNSCQENPEFSLCQQFTTTDYSDVSNDQFIEKLEEYKTKKEEEEKKKKSIFYNIGKFLEAYGWYIVIGLVILGVAIIVIIMRRRKKSRLL